MAEAGWLIDRQLGAAAEAGFYRSILNADIAVEEVTPADWQRIAELVDTYADLGLGGVDASLVAMAERLGVTELATLDSAISESSVPGTSTPSRCCLMRRRKETIGRRRDLSVT